MKCRYCGRDCKNANSHRNHERLCRSNPERVIKPKTQKWYESIAGRKGANQYTKAKELGLAKPAIQEATREKLSRAKKGKKLSNDTKEKLSEIRSKYIEEKGGGGFLDIGWYSIKNIAGIEFKVRGTWELKYAEYLNSKGILWDRNISFKYIKEDGVQRTYYPDFHLPLTQEYKEVKGYFSEKDKTKIRLVEEQNKVKIDLLFKEDLESLGVNLY